MRFNISQNELQNALSIVGKGVASRSTLPVLSGIYISTEEDYVVFQSTDLTLSIQYKVPALVEEMGEIVVPARLFTDIIKSLKDASVLIETEGDITHIYCDTSSFNIKSLNPEDWPGFPTVEPQQSVTIPFADFSQMVKRVAKMVSKDESRPLLTGVLISKENNIIRMVSTDTFRLAITEKSSSSTAENFSAVISGSFLLEVASLPKSAENISISLSENQVVISYNSTTFINRRIEGNYLNYRQLLPSSYSTRVEMNTEEFISAVKRVELLGRAASSNNYSPIKLSVSQEDSSITISSVAQDVGSAQESISCTVEGTDMEIGFNSVYVVEGLVSAGSENIVIELTSPDKPGVIKTPNGDDYLYLAMPRAI